MRIRRHAFIATAVLLLAALPAVAQRGGHSHGGHSHGGHSHGGYSHGGHSHGGFSHGGHAHSNFGFGVPLGLPLSGLGFGYGTGGFGNYGGGYYGGGYRPYGYGGGYYGGGLGGYYSPSIVVPRTYVVPQTYAVPQTYVVPQTTYLAPAAPAAPTVASETGLVITELKAQGTAKAAGLRQGDVILAVDGKRIQNYEELRAVLTAAGKKSASVEFIDGSNNQIEKKDVGVLDGKMGITIEEVPVKRS